MRESWGRVRKWVQIIMMLTGPVVLAIALCNVTSEKLWQARAEEVQQIKKEKGLNGENSVRRAVALEKIQWEKAEKVYDGKREAVLTGYYQEKKEENRVTVEVQLEGSNVKTYTEAVIQKVIKQPQNYELAECEQKKISGIHMKVIPKNLYLQVEDHSVDYGVTMETLEADLRKHGKVFIKEGILQEDLEKVMLPEVILRDPYPELKIGSYDNCLIPKLKREDGKLANPFEGVVQGNYCMKVAQEEDYGTLEVLPQKLEEAEDVISVEHRAGIFQKEEGKNIYVRGTRGDTGEPVKVKLHIREESSFAQRYDEVWVRIKEEGGVFVNATKEGIVFEEQQEGVQRRTGEWYLKDSRDGSGKTVTEVADGLVFVIDSEAPEVIFHRLSLEKNKIGGEERGLNFGTYQNTSYAEKVSVEDQNSLDERGSGVDRWSYAVWNVKKDQKLTKNLVEKLTISGELQWNPVEEETCEILIGIENQGKVKEGNYVLLVRVEDQVQNQAVFLSDGIVVDLKQPKVTLRGIDSEKYYTEDIPFSITVEDFHLKNQKITSGIKEICVALSCDGTECFCETEQIRENFPKSGTEVEKTLQELQTEAKVSREKIIQASRHNSNDVKLSVTVSDHAGNQTVAEERLKIDTVAPQIIVAYDNNDKKNGNYFQEERTAQILYQDKNFEQKNVTFDVGVGKKQQKNVRVQDLEKEFGILAEWRRQEGKEGECLYLKFQKEQEYKIRPHCKDRAGNVEQRVDYGDSEAPEQFVIDTTDPVAEIRYYCDGEEILLSEEVGWRSFTDKAIEAKIVICERNFSFPETFSEEQSQMELSVKAEGMQEGEYPQEVEGGYFQQAAKRKNWKKIDTDTYTATFLFEKDANYIAEFTYMDLAGRKVSIAPRRFTVDQTAPKGEIVVDGQKNSAESWRTVSFSLFQRDAYQIQITGEDVTAGVASVKYYCSKRPLSEEDVKNLPSKEWVKGDAFAVNPDQQCIVYGKVEDLAGNICFLYPVSGMITECSEPKIKMTLEGEKSGGVYRGDVTVKIEAEDLQAGDTYSGIQQVFYHVAAEENVQADKEEILFQKEDHQTRGKARWEGAVVIPAEVFNSNDVRVQVTVKDSAGNEKTENKEKIAIDITPPILHVQYDDQMPVNGNYYRKARKATITVHERNFDEKTLKIQAGSSEGRQPISGEWTRQEGGKNTDQDTYVCTMLFQEDGVYKLSLNCTDKAGNQTIYENDDVFVIDQTAPVIRVSYQEQTERTKGYYHKPRTAVISIQEKNFRPEDVAIKITAVLDGEEQKAPEIGMFTSEGVDSETSSQNREREAVHRATILYDKDGTYTFNVSYTDLAGNMAKEYPEDRFTIDRTSPSVEIFGVENKSANNDIVAPQIRYQDRNYEEKDVKIELTGYHRGKLPIEGQKTEIVNGQYIKLPDFERTKEKDDLYTLTVQVTDRAGNVTKKSITFSVNRFGSVYTLSDKTRKLLQKHYTKQPQEIEVTEINIDTLQMKEISYGRDGEVVRLQKGKDYAVEKNEPEQGWKTYTYKIGRHNFQKEGNYTVTLSSKDRAENRGNNKIKGEEINFVVDQTAPTVVVTGIENYGKYKESSKKMTIYMEDNFAAEAVEVSVHGERKIKKRYDAERLKRQGGRAEVVLRQENRWKTVRVSGVDAAGNRSEEKVFQILVTPDRKIQFFYNLPSIVGVALMMHPLLCGVIFFIRKQRRKQTRRKDFKADQKNSERGSSQT